LCIKCYLNMLFGNGGQLRESIPGDCPLSGSFILSKTRFRGIVYEKMVKRSPLLPMYFAPVASPTTKVHVVEFYARAVPSRLSLAEVVFSPNYERSLSS
ncbi:MAG: hypothetical protein ABXS92_04670, partial [Sulfurimonas sp.]